MESDRIDLLAFTGHKSLLGPMGTGGLILGKQVDLAQLPSLTQGGTGSRSEEEVQPDFLPDKFESGTQNAVGLAGLAAGIDWIQDKTLDTIREHDQNLTASLISGMTSIPGVTVYGPHDSQLQTATVSFNIRNWSPSEVGLTLDDRFNILCRVGLHCAPAAHKTIHTFPEGTVRFGLGVFNTMEEVEQGIQAVRHLAKERP
jgi:selenocysteine lyase/cysteine desulfurase